jgi:hypothetical protein
MGEKAAENLVTVVIPDTDQFVVNHHNRAKTAITEMSPSRQFGAETNLRSWRRLIKTLDPVRDNGWAFSGDELKPGATASLPVGGIIIACDVSWTKANWYAGRHMAPTEIEAALYEVSADGLVALIRSMRRRWARDLIRWLVSNRPEIVIQSPIALTHGEAR